MAVGLSLAVGGVGCSSDSGPPAATATEALTVQPPPERTPSPEPTTPAQATPSATPPAATSTPTPVAARTQPQGFPIEPSTRLGAVMGEVGARTIDWEAGATAAVYSGAMQVSDDPVSANAMGWNCRTHVEYEGTPAVDWYLAPGTPVYATMDGFASLYAISIPNAFDYYGADREPYIGNPDRTRAPLSPFPGPGGGKGVYVEVVNSDFATEYGHLDVFATLEAVPADRYNPPYSGTYDYDSEFNVMRAFNDETLIATWPVRAGDVIGYTGDSGYSEAPHLHYTVRRLGGDLLCPTEEQGFDDGGWLAR